jgi:hypothetical protein
MDKRVHFENDPSPTASAGEGAYSLKGTDRSYLPLRGKRMDDPTPRPLRRETKCTCEAPVPSGGLVLFVAYVRGTAIPALQNLVR